MLENNIVVPSFSSWASICLLVPKSDGTSRFCSDFRKVNKVTKPDSFPLPRTEDCVDQVGAARYVTKFDLLKGHWQVPLSCARSGSFYHSFWAVFLSGDAIWVAEGTSHVSTPYESCGGWAGWVCSLFRRFGGLQ